MISRAALAKRRRLGLRQLRRLGRKPDPRLVGMAGTTRNPCSCWICGNKRRAYGPTRQEMRAAEKEDFLLDFFLAGE